MNKSVEILKSLIKVKQIEKNYFISDEDVLYYIGITNWDKNKIGDEMIK